MNWCGVVVDHVALMSMTRRRLGISLFLRSVYANWERKKRAKVGANISLFSGCRKNQASGSMPDFDSDLVQTRSRVLHSQYKAFHTESWFFLVC